MLLSALRPSQRAVLEKQLRKNIESALNEGSEEFLHGHLEMLLEDTECQAAPEKGEDLRSWWAAEVHRKQAVEEWNVAVQAFAESEAERLGVDSYSAKATYVPCPKALMEALLLTEDVLSDVASEDEESEEEESEEESEEETEESEEDIAEEAVQLGIKRRKS